MNILLTAIIFAGKTKGLKDCKIVSLAPRSRGVFMVDNLLTSITIRSVRIYSQKRADVEPVTETGTVRLNAEMREDALSFLFWEKGGKYHEKNQSEPKGICP